MSVMLDLASKTCVPCRGGVPPLKGEDVTSWTHKIDGLTESDFILAAKIDQVYKS